MEVTSTPTGGYYDIGNKIEFTVTFSGLVEAGTESQFAFDLGGATRQAEYARSQRSGNGGGVLSTPSRTRTPTTATASPGAPTRSASMAARSWQLHPRTCWSPGMPTWTTPRRRRCRPRRWTPPSRASRGRRRKGTTLTLTFSEDLDTTTAPANTVFMVKVDGAATGTNPTAVSIIGSEVSLTLGLGGDARAGRDSDLHQADGEPDQGPVSGKKADAFTDENVTTAPPVEVTATFTQASYTVAEGATEDVTVRLNKDPERRLTILLTATGQSGATAADYSVTVRRDLHQRRDGEDGHLHRNGRHGRRRRVRPCI